VFWNAATTQRSASRRNTVVFVDNRFFEGVVRAPCHDMMIPARCTTTASSGVVNRMSRCTTASRDRFMMPAKSARWPSAISAGPCPDLGRELSTAVVLFHQAVAAQVGLSAADLKTLDLIARDGPFSATELAGRTGLTQAAITSLVGRLSAGGHVTRETDPADRRRAVIKAVPATDPVLSDAFAHLGRAMGGIITDYNPAEQAAIVDYLNRTIAVLREQTARLSGLSC
jgi:DNA-binding MarR family transcriptional regulator